MIDIYKLKYKVVLITEAGTQLDITNAVTSAGWEENEGELAVRINLTAYNTKYNGQDLSSIAKPGCLIAVIAGWGGEEPEVARGIITDWEPSISGDQNEIALTAYDELFYLQQSQDNRYITEGTGTKAAVTAVFDDWKIPLGEYKGPDIPHAKTLFKNETISEILLQLLDTAEKQGAGKHIIRASKGTVSVLPLGGNETVYHFDENGSITKIAHRISTQNLVTRVKIVGKEEDDERQPVEAVVDGDTKYGIRQKIFVRSEDDSLAAATASAQQILAEEGKTETEITIEAPDVPTLRKGDLVHFSGQLDGYYSVESIAHDAGTCIMTMTVEKYQAEEEKVPVQTASAAASPSAFGKGDVVILNGAVYVDSYGNGKGKTFSNRKCTITIKVDTSRPCPYHVDGIGWVYPNTIAKEG